MEVCRIKLNIKYLLCFCIIVICQIGYHLMGGGIGSALHKNIQSLIGNYIEGNAKLLRPKPPIETVQSFQHISFSHKTSNILVKLPDRRLYLYTALLSNSSSEKSWDRLAITGWEHKETSDKQLICCVKLKSGHIRRTSKVNRVRNIYYYAVFKPIQYECCLSGLYKPADAPISATIIIKSKGQDTDGHCPVEESRYVRIEHVYSQPTQIAAISKVIYGNVSLINLVAWLEIHQTLGLNKVVFYSHRLGQNVSKVLQYYQTKNFVEVIPVTFPDPGFKAFEPVREISIDLKYAQSKDSEQPVPGQSPLCELNRQKWSQSICRPPVYQKANFPSLTKTYNYWVDEEIVLIDAQERLRGYKYVFVFDIDEYIIPWSNKTWIDLMEEMSRSQPEAAGFKISGYMYASSWGVSSNTSLLQIGRYFQRTGPTFDRKKYIFIPSRVEVAGLHAHTFAKRQGYYIPTVPEKLAVLSHYRTCGKKFDRTSGKCLGYDRHFDDYNYRRFSFIEDRVIRLLKKILDLTGSLHGTI